MLILMRLIHILSGAVWVGTAVFSALYLIPSVRALGPGGGPVMQQIGQKRKLPAFFAATGILTILSGIGLYWRASGGFSNTWMHSGTGVTFGIGAAFAILAMLIGIFVSTPAAKRVSALGATMAAAGRPPSPEQAAEMQQLQAKLASVATLGAALLVLTTAAMAVARYIP